MSHYYTHGPGFFAGVLLILAGAMSLPEWAGAATSATATAAAALRTSPTAPTTMTPMAVTAAATKVTSVPIGRAGTTTAPLIRDADVGLFFPPRQHEGNAASAYVKAFESYDADRERTRYWEKWDLLLERRSMRTALDQITSGELCKSCDFLPFLPDDLSRASKFPYLVETSVLAKLLSKRFERELAAGRRDEALATARTLMAFGRHLRGSALVLSQDLQGLACERLAVGCFRSAYGPKTDTATSAKLALITELLDRSQQFIQDARTEHRAAGPTAFSADLQWLHSPHPVLRSEAIISMAQQTFPPPVLIKPTPSIDIGALLQKFSSATTGTKIRVRREEVEAKIRWPRKGVRAEVTAEDVKKLREALEPLAQSDPDHRVKVLAQRFLDALVEPPPAPAPPGGTQPSSMKNEKPTTDNEK